MFSLFIVLLTMLMACSEEKATSAPKVSENSDGKAQEEEPVEIKEFKEKEIEYYEVEEIGRVLTDFEKELLRKPGEFSADNYDEMKVNERLDELPDYLSAQQYFDEILYLLSEDYHQEVETLLNFDSTVDVNIPRPDETVDTPEMKSIHYALLMDASGSMAGNVDGQTKMHTAKNAVLEFVKNIPENATMSLRVYGHKGTGNDADKNLSCSSTENIYEGVFNEEKVDTALDSVKPAGWTPIALALNSVKDDISESADDVVVYVVSDGIETCDGDPVSAAKMLTESNIKTVVNIIGFNVDNEGQKLLKEVADAGNGEFTYVNSEREFKNYMREQYEVIQKQWLEWKDSGKQQALDLKEEKKKLASETKESIKEKSARQKERMKKAQTYLREKHADGYIHPIGDTWKLIIDYCNAIWSYGVDFGNAAWRESVDNGNEEWQNYVDEGNKKINETIDKKNNQ